MLYPKDVIAHFYWSNADGPLDVRVFGRFTKGGLVIHGVSLENIYPCGKPRLSLLPRPFDFMPVVLVEVRKGLLNGEHIRITTPAGRPSIGVWGGGIRKPGRVPNQCTRGWRVEWRPRGRPKGSGRFANAEDFRRTVISDLRTLRKQGLNGTQKELAQFWYGSDPGAEPKAELDSLVAEIKRYCRKWGPWKKLVEESREK